MPSMHAEARPRLPMRWMQRTRAVALRALAHQVFAAVVGVVDHHNGLPVEAGKRLIERVQQLRNVLALAIRRNHHGDLRHLAHPFCGAERAKPATSHAVHASAEISAPA